MVTLERKKSRKASSKFTQQQVDAARQRTLELLRTEIDFIPNPEFRTESLDNNDIDRAVQAKFLEAGSWSGMPSELPAHMRRMCASDLLTHAEEKALFREMNLSKYRANALRSRLDPSQPDRRAVAEIDGLLDRAQAVRELLIKSNMRLVMSVVKKLVTPQQSFDEMLSDGIIALMNAVEKFDFDRGFRFSTYAYRSIARGAYRAVASARKEEARFTRDAEDWAFEQEGDSSSSPASDRVWSNLRDLMVSMLGKLDRREQFIIRSRFALGAHRKVRTFQYLADKLGISKERARQIEKRAVEKLRGMAEEHELDELFGAAFA